MKIYDKHKNILLEVTCLLFTLLFAYAAMSKLFVFNEFKIQIEQSSILAPFADIVAWMVPYLETLTSLLLFMPRFRVWGLYITFSLMVLFTAYTILNFSNDTSCFCGGLLEKLGWTEHLIFNITFVILAFISIHIINGQKSYITPKYISL